MYEGHYWKGSATEEVQREGKERGDTRKGMEVEKCKVYFSAYEIDKDL